MSMNDTIADMLTRIRNANSATLPQCTMPTSKKLEAIAKILLQEGYIADYRVEKSTPRDTLVIVLKYGQDNERTIAGIKRISKPGLRNYVNSREIPRVLGGLGIAIISTSSGIMTDYDARQKGVGGEVLAHVW
ncbi:MAG: 30S ribosomal protein S8 [Coriobacteriia bacterium]|nr:30S ribosomal protein S8 [Coriobacteriia bacterium]